MTLNWTQHFGILQHFYVSKKVKMNWTSTSEVLSTEHSSQYCATVNTDVTPASSPCALPQPVCVDYADFQLGQTWEAPLGKQREKAEWSQDIYCPVTTEQKSIPQQVQTMSRTFSLSSSTAYTLHQAALMVLVLLSSPSRNCSGPQPFQHRHG